MVNMVNISMLALSLNDWILTVMTFVLTLDAVSVTLTSSFAAVSWLLNPVEKINSEMFSHRQFNLTERLGFNTALF